MTQWVKLLGVVLGLTALLTSCSGGNSLAPAPTATLTANPSVIASGQHTTLNFSSTNADMGSIDSGVGQVGINGRVSVSPTETTTYTFTATGPGGSATASATVTVSPSPTATISAKPTSISAGQAVTLTVAASNASQVVITDNEDSNTYTLPSTGGTQVVNPIVTTTYTATATGVNQSTATASVVVTVPPIMISLTSFDGLNSDDVQSTSDDVDPNGAIGTLQFMEYVNTSYQAYDKAQQTNVYTSAVPIGTPWQGVSAPCAGQIELDSVVIFDRLASRWVIGAKTTQSNNYNFCIAVSKTDDLSSCASTPATCWNGYSFPLNAVLETNSEGHVYFPDWPKLATGPNNAYYATMDLNDPDNGFAEVGVIACAFDRANMLAGASQGALNPMQCFRMASPLSNGIYLSHSLIPADIDGTTPPPAGRDEFMVSIQNPPRDGTSTTSNTLNLWDFHLDWTTPANSTFTQSALTVAPYTPGCYTAALPGQTICVPEPPTATSGQHIDSVGDRFMPRFGYRNFGTYESFLVSHAVQTGPGGSGQNAQQTGIRWYELRSSSASQLPSVFNDGTISPDTSLFRFLPSIAQDQVGNAAVGYSVSNSRTDPGINVSWWNLPDPGAPTEGTILTGSEEEVTSGTGDGKWGTYSSMTVDPVDDCTFWYVNEYFGLDASSNVIWKTNISHFEFSGCP
jgi:hypothetical protein